MYTAKSELNKGNAHAKKTDKKSWITGKDEGRRSRVDGEQWQKSGLKFERDDTST